MERPLLPTLLIATDTWELVYDYNRILLPRGIRTAPHPLNHRLLTRVREHHPVAILLDFSVAEREHGLFLLDALRHDPRTAACPVIVMLDDPDAYTAITHRAYPHVSAHLKPVSAMLLLSLVGEYAPALPLTSPHGDQHLQMHADD
jgi:DNA-binding NtrC family response regulator